MNLTPRSLPLALAGFLAIVTASASASLIACSNDPSGSPADDAGTSATPDASLDATTGGNDAGTGQAADAAPLDASSADSGSSDSGTRDGSASCTPNAGRCTGATGVDAERCDENGVWQPQGVCPYACQAGACVGVCGAGSTQCCEKFDDGPIECGNTEITPCISGTTCPTPHPSAVVVRTCNTAGEWEETSNCQSACAPDPDRVIVGCNICGGAATCLESVNESCACATQ